MRKAPQDGRVCNRLKEVNYNKQQPQAKWNIVSVSHIIHKHTQQQWSPISPLAPSSSCRLQYRRQLDEVAVVCIAVSE